MMNVDTLYGIVLVAAVIVIVLGALGVFDRRARRARCEAERDDGPAWVKINRDTDRLLVEGGALYRICNRSYNHQYVAVFVPHAGGAHFSREDVKRQLYIWRQGDMAGTPFTNSAKQWDAGLASADELAVAEARADVIA
jgi:hypothetical protein